MFKKLREKLNIRNHIQKEDLVRFHFLESNVWPIQLLLLASAGVPRLIASIKEGFWKVEKKLVPASLSISEDKRPWVKPVVFSSCMLVLAAAVVFFSYYTFDYTVIYQGEEVGIIHDMGNVETACANVEKAIGEATGCEYHIDREDLTVVKSLTRLSNVLTEKDLETIIYSGEDMVTYGYTITVDGTVVGSTIYKGALEDMLSQLKADHYTENTSACNFVEEVEITEGLVPNNQVMTLGQMLETLNSTKEGEETYTIKKGDTWSKIASSHGLTNEQLLAMNPGYKSYMIYVGDQLVTSSAVPYLTIKQTERVSYVDTIAYDVEYVDDSSMYEGNYRVVSAGVSGTADVVADITYVNGEEIERTILSSVTTSEPVTEVQARGTKPRPSWYPSGTFSWPVSGKLSSYFGSRYIFGSYSNHKGIDIVCSYGTGIKASDGGVVTYSGWQGSYGYLVCIDHLNGYVTYYAHNSSLLVSVGDHVYKGQIIAKAGSTGRSTGVHCHFGIEYNGSFINPLSKLP